MGTLYIPGGLPGRSRTIVVPAGGSLDEMAWPVKDITEILPSMLDLSAMVAELGVWVTSVDGLVADITLSAVLVGYTPGGRITLRIGGGNTATPSPALAFNVGLSDGSRLRPVVTQPIEDRTPAGLVAVGVDTVPPGAILFGGRLITYGGTVITYA